MAEGLKLIFKESITPAQADRFVYFLAPMLAVIPAISLFAVIPISNNAFFNLAACWTCRCRCTARLWWRRDSVSTR